MERGGVAADFQGGGASITFLFISLFFICDAMRCDGRRDTRHMPHDKQINKNSVWAAKKRCGRNLTQATQSNATQGVTSTGLGVRGQRVERVFYKSINLKRLSNADSKFFTLPKFFLSHTHPRRTSAAAAAAASPAAFPLRGRASSALTCQLPTASCELRTANWQQFKCCGKCRTCQSFVCHFSCHQSRK